jgi:hypothetical protein
VRDNFVCELTCVFEIERSERAIHTGRYFIWSKSYGTNISLKPLQMSIGRYATTFTVRAQDSDDVRLPYSIFGPVWPCLNVEQLNPTRSMGRDNERSAG